MLVATAALLDHMGGNKEAARAYCRCCWLMEELAPHNAYHAKWALEALLCASRAGLPLQGYVAYTRKVLTCHIGPGALEEVLSQKLGHKRSSALLDSDDKTRLRAWPPGEVGITYKQHQGGGGIIFELQLHLDEAAKAREIDISASEMVLDIRVQKKRFYLVLPGKVREELTPEPVRLTMRGCKILASFHLQSE